MDTLAIYQRLNSVFRDVLDDESIDLRPETTAADIEAWDSLAHVRLMIATETEFGVRFKTADISGIKDVAALAALIGQKLV